MKVFKYLFSLLIRWWAFSLEWYLKYVIWVLEKLLPSKRIKNDR